MPGEIDSFYFYLPWSFGLATISEERNVYPSSFSRMIIHGVFVSLDGATPESTMQIRTMKIEYSTSLSMRETVANKIDS